MKTCRLCGLQKAIEEFGLAKLNTDGRDSRCKECRRIKYLENRETILSNAKTKYASNPEMFRARKSESYARCKDSINERQREKRKLDPSILTYEKNRYNDIRASCFTALGGACSCGVSDPDVLCVDHVFDDGQEERASGVAPVTIWRKAIREKDSGRYQLLCFNCNLRKSVLRDKIGHDKGVVKVCHTCRKELDTSFFKLDKKYHDGVYYECRKCARNRVVVLKTIAVLSIGDLKCRSCGDSDIISLTFDHISDDGFLTRKTDGRGESLYRRIVNRSVDVSRFQVLCLNCNLKKHRNTVGAWRSIAGFSSFGGKACDPKPSVEPIQHEVQTFSFDETTVVHSVDVAKAVEFFEQNHYAGYGRYGSFHILCTLRGNTAAAAKFAAPVRQEVASSIGVPYSNVLELDRFCIHPSFRKKNFASFFLAAASRKIHEIAPSISHLVSFADPEQGHTGSIYRAANWKECVAKRLRPDYRYEDKHGKRVHKKTVWDQAKIRGIGEHEYAIASGLTRISTPPKKKFVLSLA